MIKTDEQWMLIALKEAKQAADRGEVPVGAVLTGPDGFIAAAGNNPINGNDPTAHAEILTLRKAAAAAGNYRLVETTLYVTLEPCLMCMGALVHARVKRLVFGATDPKTGAAQSLYTIGRDSRLNHTIELTGGVLAAECGEIIREFFRLRRNSG